MKRLLLGVFIILLLTGCWNRRELNEMAITYGLGIDKDGDDFVVTAQVINPEQVSGQKGGGASGTRSPVILHEERDKTVLGAIRKLSRTASRKIYVAHLYILVFGEDFAKEGIGDALDLIFRDQEFRTDFYVFIAKGSTARDVLATATPFAVSPAQEIYDRLRYSNRHYNPAKATGIRELISNTTAEGIVPVIPSLLFEKSTTSSNQESSDAPVPEPPLPTGNLAVLDRDQLVGWLNEGQADTFNTIINNIKHAASKFVCKEDQYGAIESTDVKAILKPEFKTSPKMNIKIKLTGKITELDCDQFTTTPKEIRQLEKIIARYLEEMHTNNIKEVQEDIGVDIFGFGREFFRKKPEAWKKLKNNWSETFRQLEVKVNVAVQITGTGTTDDSYLKRLRKEKNKR
ncbi:MAG TPA: Ger(x)C family spore germination protein [Cerasibacillus sp.]|uniref:Ger(x)C family spore germination protein n=1 Tax=Cerasibacillus sp. TaxID=2498711 RepID=UPI002F424DD0